MDRTRTAPPCPGREHPQPQNPAVTAQKGDPAGATAARAEAGEGSSTQSAVCDPTLEAAAHPLEPGDERPTTAALVVADPQELARSVLKYADASTAPRTREEYRKHWTTFCAWCAEHGLCELPAAPQTLALYLAARADQGLKVATLNVALSAIAREHHLAGYPSPAKHPLVRETWKGIRRKLGIAQTQKQPISVDELRKMIDDLPAGLRGQRDRALITLGFAGAFRRSELVALNVADLRFAPQGLEVLVRRSKTDQEGHGLLKVVAYGSDPATCPVRSVQDWLELAGISEGPVFRAVSIRERVGAKRLRGHAVAFILKRAAAKAGLSTKELAGHSLRAGFVTTAKENGADDARSWTRLATRAWRCFSATCGERTSGRNLRARSSGCELATRTLPELSVHASLFADSDHG